MKKIIIIIASFLLSASAHAGLMPSLMQARGTGGTGSLVAATALPTSGSVADVRQAILNRHQDYSTIVVVTTTIASALESITDASASKRYLLFIPDGTYSETNIITKDYVDLWGQSKAGTIIAGDNTNSTIWCNGQRCMIANLTITHTQGSSDGGLNKYCIHADGRDDTSPSETIFYNLHMQTYGTFAKTCLGIGIHPGQVYYIVDCTAVSPVATGIGSHNWYYDEPNAAELYLLNTSATGAVYGMYYANCGSHSGADTVVISGGTYSGGTYDLRTLNYASPDPYSGHDETAIYVDGTVTYDSSSFLSTPIATVQTIPFPTE